MKLFYMPGACSLSPNIVAHEAGIEVQLVLVGRDKKLPDGSDYRAINPNGYVPALQLDDGTVLTEGPAIVQYLADRKPEANLAPANGTVPRYQLQSWLNFISTELHKTVSPLFNPKTPDDYKAMAKERVADRLASVDAALGGKPYLTGDHFSVADAYLYVILRWTAGFQIDIARWPNLKALFDRISARPAVVAALDAEKLKRPTA
jgi:glutathione S-transferase